MSLFQVNKKQKFNRLFIVLNIATLYAVTSLNILLQQQDYGGEFTLEEKRFHDINFCVPNSMKGQKEGETKAQIALGSKPAFLLLEPQKDSDISLLAIGPKTFWPFSPISINMQPCHPSQSAFSNNPNDQTFYQKCTLGQGN